MGMKWKHCNRIDENVIIKLYNNKKFPSLI